MFVSESTLNFMGTKLQLISTEGHCWDAAFDPSATVDSIKRLAIQYFYPSESSVNPDQFRVIYPADRRTLTEHHALHEERVKDNDVLLFVRRRHAASVASASTAHRHPDAELKPPTAADILAATKDLPVPSIPAKSKPVQEPNPSHAHGGGNLQAPHHPHQYSFDDGSEHNVDFQMELRKIIISLISVMVTLLHGNPDADLVCQEMYTRIKHRLKSSTKPIEGTSFQFPPPPEIECTPHGIISGLSEAKKREFKPSMKAFESLKEMGFNDGQIIEALRANKNSKDAACEWILAGKKNTDDEEEGLDQNGHLLRRLVLHYR
ncbi:Ubiquitin-associated domain-containing protein 1 [Orchesella cincta]|uniref:Ubiquitin-associated domain-containing protein 1 n=1 Tax=Orchesella cincta TaxID=48709 RepID=A0A1D2MG85_ORCCI|nr:Ubiquitin-associated domain-containing protein 1 [Orchesella cincta]